ncbi:hypothetical protein MHU86_3412 [Fragilaria crotonensis]|nr:hypothetical protein MHU86_3412 [Fragilaria crotonensis]
MTKDAFTEGQLVRVEARTWPGINKHGGVGRIIRRIENEVDVQYVLGGGEKGVPLEYVSTIEEVWSQKSLRDRSILLGRCKHCGSLRADCGSCDLQQQYQQAIEMAGTGANPRQAKHVGIVLDDRNGNASSDNSRPLPDMKRKQHENPGNLQMNTPHQEILESDCEESDSSSDDELLSAFQNDPRLRRNLALLNRLERDTRPRIPNANERTMDIVDGHGDEDGAEMTQKISQSKLESRVMMSNDRTSQSFSVPQRSRHQRMHDSLTSAPADRSCSPRQDGELLVDNDLDGFIQPEGAATSAPRGSEDNTLHLAFRELPGFFDATVNRVGDALPEARSALRDIARRVEIREAVGGLTTDLEEEGWQLYSSTKESLVLSGLDQCRYMYRRLTSREELRKHEATLTSREKKQFGERAQSIRDILFDQIDKEVEDFLRELRHYLSDLKSSGTTNSSERQTRCKASLLKKATTIFCRGGRWLGKRFKHPTGRRTGSRLENPKRRSIALNARKRFPAETPDVARPTSIEFLSSGKLNKSRSLTTSASDDLPRSGRAGEREIAVADRMQAFLDANRDNIDACLEPVPSIKTQGHPRLGVVRIADEPNAASAVLCTSSIRNWDEDIFRTLSIRETVMPVTHDVREKKQSILNCIEVLRLLCQPSPPAAEFLDRVYRDPQSDDASMSSDDVVSIFSLIHSYLKKNPESLQELLSTSRPKLSRHLRILEAILTLLRMDLQRQLQKVDGIVFSLFSGDEPCCFVQMLILQMLDVLFALFNPEAWATDGISLQVDVLGMFAPLRDALAHLVSLVELSCQFVLHRVECQRWFRSSDGSMSFVSSVDPDMYRSFLERAEIPSPVCVRIKQFNSKIPRVEVKALWSMLGFMAASNFRTSPPTSRHRWLLVYTILCCETGVLPKTLEGHERTKPNTDHIARCEIELGYLNLLVSRGAMMPLDGTDKIIGTLLKRLILLQANSIRDDVFFYRSHEVSFLTDKVLDEWESSALRHKSIDAEPRSVVLDRHFLLPGLLQNAVDLLASWTSQTWNKPVLWTQLALSISKLQELEKAYPAPKIGDLTFADLFQEHERCGTLFVREAAVAVLTAFDIVRSECTVTGKKPYISCCNVPDLVSRIGFMYEVTARGIERKCRSLPNNG